MCDIKFIPEQTNFIYDSMPLFSQNNLYFGPLHKCDAVIHFGDWSLEVHVDSERKTLVSLEGMFNKKAL